MGEAIVTVDAAPAGAAGSAVAHADNAAAINTEPTNRRRCVIIKRLPE
jgi:hypothetical protein